MRLIIPAYFQAKNKSGKMTDYIPTSNHMYTIAKIGKRTVPVIKKEAKDWYDLAAWRAKEWVQKTGWIMPSKETPVVMNIWYFFKDHKYSDPGNLHKALGDFHHGIIVEDDKALLWRDQKVEVDRENPRIELEFEIVKEEPNG